MKTLFKKFLVLFYLYNTIANFCTLIKDKKTKKTIENLKSIKPNSSGSFGKVWIIDDVVYKMIEVKSDLENELTKNELRIMDSITGEYDLVSIKENACLYEVPYRTMKETYIDKKVVFNTYYIKMDYMQGGMLKTFLINEWSNVNFRLFDKFDILFKLALSVKKLHDKGFKHLDIKPENFFMLNKYTPVLGDFGFSIENDKKKRDFCAGTPNFIAPEIFNHKNYYCSSDVYALGITFYQMINRVNLPLKKRNEKHKMMNIEIGRGKNPTKLEYNNLFYKLVKQMTREYTSETQNNREKRITIEEVLTKMLELLPEILNWENYEKASPKEIIDNHYKAELKYLKESDYSVTQRLVNQGDIIIQLNERKKMYYQAVGLEIEEDEEEEILDLGELILRNEGVPIPTFDFIDGDIVDDENLDQVNLENLYKNELEFQNIDFSKLRNSVLVVANQFSVFELESDNLNDGKLINKNTKAKSIIEQHIKKLKI